MAEEKKFLKEKLSITADYYIILFGWVLLFFTILGDLYVYVTFQAELTYFDIIEDGYFSPGVNTALVKITNDIFTLGAVVTFITIIYLLDRHFAIEKLRKMKVKVKTFSTFGKSKYRMNNYTKVIIVITLLISMPWIFANSGMFVSDVPVLGNIYLAKQDFNGHSSVHLGSHHGYKGFTFFLLMILVFTTVKYLYNKKTKIVAGLVCCYLLAWGFYNMFQDFFTEQIFKRGLVNFTFPNATTYFQISFPLAVISGVLIYTFVWRRLETKIK